MKKNNIKYWTIALILLLGACHSSDNSNIAGIWKLETMDINGTVIGGGSLGNWLWEFNGEGGYLMNVSGAEEKGVYKIKDKRLNLKSYTFKDRPAQEYRIEQLDSAVLRLVTDPGKNQTRLLFNKVGDAEVGEKD